MGTALARQTSDVRHGSVEIRDPTNVASHGLGTKNGRRNSDSGDVFQTSQRRLNGHKNKNYDAQAPKKGTPKRP